MDNDEVIYPPQGFCIFVHGTRADGFIGPFATEDEARHALSTASICVVGAHFAPDWDRRWPTATAVDDNR